MIREPLKYFLAILVLSGLGISRSAAQYINVQGESASFGFVLVGSTEKKDIHFTISSGKPGRNYLADISLAGDTLSFDVSPKKNIAINYYTGADIEIDCTPLIEGKLHAVIHAIPSPDYSEATGKAELPLFAYGFKKYDSTYLFIDKNEIDFGNVDIGKSRWDTVRITIPDSSKHYVVFKILQSSLSDPYSNFFTYTNSDSIIYIRPVHHIQFL